MDKLVNVNAIQTISEVLKENTSPTIVHLSTKSKNFVIDSDKIGKRDIDMILLYLSETLQREESTIMVNNVPYDIFQENRPNIQSGNVLFAALNNVRKYVYFDLGWVDYGIADTLNTCTATSSDVAYGKTFMSKSPRLQTGQYLAPSNFGEMVRFEIPQIEYGNTHTIYFPFTPNFIAVVGGTYSANNQKSTPEYTQLIKPYTFTSSYGWLTYTINFGGDSAFIRHNSTSNLEQWIDLWIGQY